MPSISREARFDFRKRVAYDPDRKRLFHINAERQLRKLAEALGLGPDAYDLRSNEGGVAVSGEVILHADHLYVHASQPATGADTGVMFRTCERTARLHRRTQSLRFARSSSHARTAGAAHSRGLPCLALAQKPRLRQENAP